MPPSPCPRTSCVFQTPSAGRWVLQPFGSLCNRYQSSVVSNPISGEVGAAASWRGSATACLSTSFKPHQRGGGCCSQLNNKFKREIAELEFQTPSAGRWVLQLAAALVKFFDGLVVSNPISGEVGAAAWKTPTLSRWWRSFKPHQRGGGCCSKSSGPDEHPRVHVSNPISGEVGAAADSGSILGADWRDGFKPHQRGGGCCSKAFAAFANAARLLFQTPSAGRWVLQHALERRRLQSFCQFQTPSAGRWVLQQGHRPPSRDVVSIVSNPISGEVGAAAYSFFYKNASIQGSFKPHQRGGGCCSAVLELEPRWLQERFKPHQRGGGCCSLRVFIPIRPMRHRFKPHQRGGGCCSSRFYLSSCISTGSFKPHQRGGGCCSPPQGKEDEDALPVVSNPISGAVGAVAPHKEKKMKMRYLSFQTPSAGRWVL